MRVRRFGVLAFAATLGGCRTAPPNARARVEQPCDATLAALRLDGARVLSATAVPAGELPRHCRVRAEATPGPGSLVTFEVWVPEGAAWNGKLVVTGNGGYSPVPNRGDMAMALRRGYAAIGGDTGHQTANPNDLGFGVGHPERILDWGTRSIHAITEPGKRIVAALRGREASRAYYYGCSTGGHQAYAEMQRYPEDFDGVIAGAPGNDRVRLNAGFLWQYLSNHAPNDDARPIIPASKLPMVTRAAVAACDADDGVRDGVIDDPRGCGFDPATLRCAGDDGPDCLTAPQLAALARMYAGARNPRTGAVVYPGWPKGSEAGWGQYWGTTEPARADFWRLWVFADPRWDWWRFDFDRDLARADSTVGHLVDQVSDDLAPFARHGGRAIVYHGWQDPVVSPLGTIAYYERVRARQRSQAATDAFYRLFMVPGMGHCGGGTGANRFGNQGAPAPVVDAEHDLLAALERWVEQGVAPDRIVAARVENGATTRTRPLCPYPRRAVYVGSGSTDDARSFSCR